MPYKDPEKRRLHHKAYYEANREKRIAQMKAHYEANRKKKKAQTKAYQETHKGERNALQCKREALKIQATLPTTDNELIKNLYKQRVVMAEGNGEQYHVDHIIPLSIGGAHHQDNLRIITATENMEKGDKYIPTLGGIWADNDLARETKKELR